MSDARNRRSDSRCYARSSRSHGCGECREESGRGGRDGYGRQNSGGGRGGEKIGWGRQGAVRLDDPPLRRSRDEMDDGMGPARATARMGALEGPGGINMLGRQGGNDPFGGLRGMGGPGGMGGLGGMGGMGGLAGLGGMGGLGRLRGMGGMDRMGGREPPDSPMMGRNPLCPPQSPMFNPRQPFAEDPMLALRQRVFPRQEFGMESPIQDRFMGARPERMMDPRMRSPSLRSDGSFNMQAMDRPRMPYGPFQGSPMQLQNQHPNYQSPYVEDYEGSEMDAEMAAHQQQAAHQEAAHHQAAMHQMQMMNGGGGANQFFFDEGQYGDAYGGMGPMMSGGR